MRAEDVERVARHLRGFLDTRWPTARAYVRRLGFENAYADRDGDGDRAPDSGGGAVRVVPVHLHGVHALVGPVADTGAETGSGTGGAGPQRGPGVSRPCWNCVATRWQALRPAVERDVLELGPPDRTHATGASPYLTGFALDALAELALRALREHGADGTDGGGATGPLAEVHRLRLDTLRVEAVPLLADSACPVCGGGGSDTPEGGVLPLRARPKPAGDCDALRLSSAGAALPPRARAALANPVCGALGDGTRADREAATTAPVTGRTAVRGTPGLFDVHWSGHADTYEGSAALALAEGLERQAGLRPGGGLAGRVVSSRRALPYRSVDPRVCGLPGAAFHRDAGPRVVPYDDDLVLPWVRGHSLRDEQPVLVPEQMVQYGPVSEGPVFVAGTSNGCASGSSAEEAALHGLLEVVERDAFLAAWLGRAALPEIALESCRSPALHRLAARVGRGGHRLRLFDNRIDLPLPVVTAVATRRDPEGLGALCLSSAAHLDPERAAESAVREVASALSGFAARTERSLDRLRLLAADFGRVAELADHAALYGLPEMARHAGFLLGPDRARPVDELYRGWSARRPRNADLSDDLRHCRDLLTARGFDTVVVDQTGPEQAALGLRTVRVLVPGLLPIDFGAARQRAALMPRARTALRRAGLRDSDLAPAELNPAPHPFM
ncbi:hypothetical protein GCM10009801_62830 [Streptomyces albiaxialis]|uniref:YcaO domain-containing protein n=1 Tax=Streptomyces albiaxialis TaxID=329523 RepID=A0ABN2WMU5_9ACTN